MASFTLIIVLLSYAQGGHYQAYGYGKFWSDRRVARVALLRLPLRMSLNQLSKL